MKRIVPALGSVLLLAGCGSHGSSGPKPMTLSFSFVVAPGEETTKCLVAKLDNAVDYDFSRIDSHMTPGSHHLILYRDATDLMPGSAAPVEGVGDCDMGAARLFVYTTQDADHFVEMPPGIAGKLKKHQLVILEAHYVNASTQPLQATAEVTISPATGTITNHAGILFYLDTDFSIPPGSGVAGAPVYTHNTTCETPAGINIFRLGSHTHKRGTDVQIFKAPMAVASTGGTMVYENTDWSKPQELDYPADAPLTVGTGEAFRFACSWTNEKTTPIQFGESVEDEMCIMGAGYWPVVEGTYGLDGNVVCFNGTLYY